MATYSIRDLGRREILMMSAVLAGAGVPLSPKHCLQPSQPCEITTLPKWPRPSKYR